MRTKDFLNVLSASTEKLNNFANTANEYKAKHKASRKIDNNEMSTTQLRQLSAKRHEFKLRSISNRIKESIKHYDNDSDFKLFLNNLGYNTKTSVKELFNYTNYIDMHNVVKITDNKDKTHFLFFDIRKVNIIEKYDDEGNYTHTESNLLTGFKDQAGSMNIKNIELKMSYANKLKFDFNIKDDTVYLKSKNIKNKNEYTIVIRDTYNFNQIYKSVEDYHKAIKSNESQLNSNTEKLEKKGFNIDALKNHFISEYKNNDILYRETYKTLLSEYNKLDDYIKTNKLNKKATLEHFNSFNSVDVQKFIDVLKNESN